MESPWKWIKLGKKSRGTLKILTRNFLLKNAYHEHTNLKCRVCRVLTNAFFM